MSLLRVMGWVWIGWNILASVNVINNPNSDKKLNRWDLVNNTFHIIWTYLFMRGAFGWMVGVGGYLASLAIAWKFNPRQ